jgi:hypothetical protein
MRLLESLVFLFAIHADPAHVTALETAAAEHNADIALVGSIAVKESRVLTHGRYLTGAHIHLPSLACTDDPAYVARARLARRAHRRPPPCFDRDPTAQAQVTARLFGGVPRRHWARMLAGYVCGPNVACQATTGARYAAEVLATRDAIWRAMRSGR